MSTSFKSIQSVIAFVLVLSVHSFLSTMREAYCGTTCDENEDHEDALFVLVLPPLLALLFAVVKKVKRVSLLVFAFVRILVVVVAKPPLLLVKEVIIIITEREREIIPIPKGTDNRDQNVVIPYAPPPFVSLERRSNTTTNTNSLLSLSLALCKLPRIRLTPLSESLSL